MRKFCVLFLLIWVTTAWQAIAQEVQVSGKITDATTNESLPGVNIIIKGTNKGTVTDVDGTYKISVSPGSVLIYSFLGYKTQEVKIENGGTTDVALQTDYAKLDEVVVIGYGTVKKTDATGSIATISASDFNKGTITSPENLITGKASGVVITSNSGAPGGGSTIKIRGGSSLSASNNPLIIVDGVPIEQSIGGAASAIASINPADIESFSILKDASATAIYGSRASNGVILITTKRGNKKFSVNYSYQASVNTLPKEVSVLSGDEFRKLTSELAVSNPEIKLQNVINNPAYIGTENTNWQKEIYQTSLNQNHNLSVAGTVTDKLPVRLSLGYTNNPGILKRTTYERSNAAISLDPVLLDDHLKVNINFKVSKEFNDFNDQSAIADAVLYNPTLPVKNAAATRWRGYTTWTQNNTPNADGVPLSLPGVANPVAKLEHTTNTADLFRSIGNIQFDYKFHFLPDLHANMNMAFDYHKTEGRNNVSDSCQWIYEPKSGAGRIENYTETGKNQLLTFNLNYTKDIEPIKSKISAMAGYEWNHFWRENIDSAMDVAQKTYIKTLTNPKKEYYLISFFGRVNYTLMDKYLATFTLRRDGTSRFSSLNRWGLFPSAALAWKVNEEPFLKDNSAVTDLKLRLGYGVTGQQDVGDNYYPYIPTYVLSKDPSQYPLGYNNFIHMLRPNGYNQSLKWEETTTYNFALDYGFIKNRITGSIEYYIRKTKDLINSINIPVGTNFTQPLLTNIGSLETKGIEFSIDAKIITSKDLSWSLEYNVAYNKNELTKLNFIDDPKTPPVATGSVIQGTIGDQAQGNKVGYPSGSFYVYQQVYDQNGKPIEGVYIDRNGDGQINSNDMYLYKNPNPDITMGISSKLYYKNWDFSFSGRANIGNYVYNNIAEMTTYNSFKGAISNHYLTNVTSSANENKFTNQQKLSDYWIENASFFRMDNISLGYSFSNLFKKGYNLHLSAACQNVFVITKYSGLDPEINGGVDNNFYPRPRTYVFGLNFDF